MKLELEQQMHIEQPIFEWLRLEQLKIQEHETKVGLTKQRMNFVWLLHVVENNETAFKIVNHPGILEDADINALVKTINQEPTIMALEDKLLDYARENPEDGMGETIWMRNEIQMRGLEKEPWIYLLKTIQIPEQNRGILTYE